MSKKFNEKSKIDDKNNTKTTDKMENKANEVNKFNDCK